MEPGSIGGTMVTAMVPAPLYALSYHTNFQNTTLTTLVPNSSVSCAEGNTSFTRTTGSTDFEGILDASKATVLSGHIAGPVIALSTANSVGVPSLDFGRGPSSVHTTAADPIESNSVFDLSVWVKGSQSIFPSITSLEQENPTDVYATLTRCALAGYYTIAPSLCSILNNGFDGTTAQHDPVTDSELTQSILNHTTISPHIPIHDPFTSAVLDIGYHADHANTEISKSRGHGDFDIGQAGPPAAAATVPSSTVSCQTLVKSRYEDTNASGTPPSTVVTGLTRSLDASLAPQMMSNSFGPWNSTSLPSTDTRTEVAANGSLPAPGTPPSAPPTFASAGDVVAPRHMMIFVCLWAVTATLEWNFDPRAYGRYQL